MFSEWRSKELAAHLAPILEASEKVLDDEEWMEALEGETAAFLWTNSLNGRRENKNAGVFAAFRYCKFLE